MVRFRTFKVTECFDFQKKVLFGGKFKIATVPTDRIRFVLISRDLD